MLATLHHPSDGPVTHPPLVIAHGLYGSGRNWGVIARRLAVGREVVAVDMRNHGQSGWTATHSYPDMAADLAQVIGSLGGQADLMGHSMGGKAAMQLALTDGACIRRLVVADMAPVAYDHDQTQYARAMRDTDMAGVANRAEAEARLQARISDPPLRTFFLQSLDLKVQPPRWRLNLDLLEAEMPKIIGWTEVQGVFDNPALFLSGAESHYVKPEYRDKIRALFPKARFAKLAGAGHWLHAEKPREFIETVAVFLNA